MKFLELVIKFDLQGVLPQEWNFSSAIRGIFGRALKNTFCIQRNINCPECTFENCLYYVMFERSFEEGSYSPYMIRQIHSEKSTRSVNLIFSFIGEICLQLPQLLHTILKMQKYQLFVQGVKQQVFISRIDTADGYLIYDIDTGKMNLPQINDLQFCSCREEVVKIEFITPLRLKYRNRLLREFQWRPFFRSLYERLSFLNTHFGDGRLNLPNYYCNTEVSVTNVNMKWQEFYRKSHRQKQVMSLGGMIGELTLSRLDTDSAGILRLGEFLQVGKQTTFGLGKYQIKTLNKEVSHG